MEQTLRDFLLALRNSGLKISTSETIDAMNTVKFIGYHNRELLKDSLSVVLAKSLYEKQNFDECFEHFFAFNTFSNSEKESCPCDSIELSEKNHPLTEMLLSGSGDLLATLMKEAASKVNVTEIRFFTQKGLYIQRILHHMGLEGLRRDIRRLSQENSAPSRHMVETLEAAKGYLVENVRDFIEQQFALFSSAATEDVLNNYLKRIKLSNVEQRDFYRMHAIIQKMVKRLNDLHSRRKKTCKRGQLDFMKTFRNNIRHEGLLFDIKWKRKKIDRPDIIAICDVSRSVEAVARFLLLFLYSLNKELARIRTFVFCSNLIEVSRIFDEYPVEEALVKLQGGTGLGIILGSTDYGQSLLDFEKNFSHHITPKTTILMLGDARNNYGHPQTGILKSIYEKSKRLIWLNPEPSSFWGVGDSEMKRYLPCCTFAKECNTVNHLERIVDSLL